jgi:glycogen(starch) synthase
MKILFSSHFFYPSVGGIEQVSLALAREFALAGHQVKVVTSTGEFGSVPFPFEVIRRPSNRKLFELVQWCDLFFHNNISLRMSWPLLVIRRPWVIAHHTWISGVDGRVRLRDRFKLLLIRFARNIAVSQAIAEHLTVPSIVIGNPYREDIFFREPSIPRNRDLIFVGRLVSDKGVDLLLEAIHLLRGRRHFPNLTIVGAGPEQEKWQMSVKNLELTRQVEFAGLRTGPELRLLLNRHRTMVVPSRWREPFGLVTLEGMACGCRVIVASDGGLPNEVTPLAIPFERANIAALADAIEKTLTAPFEWENYWQTADQIISKYRAKDIASLYLAVLSQASKMCPGGNGTKIRNVRDAPSPRGRRG